MIRKFLATTFILLAHFSIQCQTDSVQYIAPLDIPMMLSGNFGEFRTNHFHSGIDIKTQGVQGKKIYAVADGYISRINISPYGYGKALYIDHPNGETTVYAHMKSFSDEIEAYILKRQYEEKTFKIADYPEASQFLVKQGDVIGLSGNTGHSGGPHLHFEIRGTQSEHPLNPLNYGFDIKDQVKPILKGVRLYPAEDSWVNKKIEATSFSTKNIGHGEYRLEKDTIYINGAVGIGIHGIDKMVHVNNTFSLYALEIKEDGKLVYSHKMDEMDFETIRYLNCHMDYALFKKNHWKYHKCFPAKNNQLNIYELPGTTFTLYRGDIKNIDVTASDIEGNQVHLSFVLKGMDTPDISIKKNEYTQLLLANQDNAFENDYMQILFPNGVLYDDLKINIGRTTRGGGKSDILAIGSYLQPLQDKIYITLKIPNEHLGKENLRLYNLDQKGRHNICDGYLKDGYLHATTKNLGNFVMLDDNTKPIIEQKKFPKIATSKNSNIAFSLSDTPSGVEKIEGAVDGKWMKIGYNASHSYAYGNFNEMDLESGVHEFTLTVTDASGNQKVITRKFNWK